MNVCCQSIRIASSPSQLNGGVFENQFFFQFRNIIESIQKAFNKPKGFHLKSTKDFEKFN